MYRREFGDTGYEPSNFRFKPMIPITILGRKYKIKSIRELTTAEYIELRSIKNMDFVKYIARQTGLSIDKTFFAIISKSVEKAIGAMEDITKMPRPKLKYIDYTRTIETVGQRHQIEACTLTEYKLIVFILAVSQARSANIDDVNKLYNEYMLRPWFEILPAGFFFLQTSKNGKSYGLSFLKKLLTSIKITKQKERQVLKG